MAAPKSQEQLDIERLLDRYMAAYPSRDIDALRRVQELSGAEAKTIRGEFAAAQDYRVTLEKVDINVAAGGRSAIVTSDVHRTVTRANRAMTDNVVKVLVLERRREGWMIASVR